MTTHLVWFRQDLRLHDNLALAAACRNSSARVLALYIATPRQRLRKKVFLYCSVKWMTLSPVSK